MVKQHLNHALTATIELVGTTILRRDQVIGHRLDLLLSLPKLSTKRRQRRARSSPTQDRLDKS